MSEGTPFLGFFIDFADYVHEPVQFFNVSHLFTKTKPKSGSDVFAGVEKEYSLYLARQKLNYPPYLICDLDGVINPHRNELSLKIERDDELIRNYVQDLPSDLKKRIARALGLHGHHIPSDIENVNLPLEIAHSMTFLMPIPKLKDPEILNVIPWKPLTNELVSWFCDKDPRLRITHKAQILRGIKPRLNPHSLQCTNSGTGKTTFYDHTGVCYGKTTPNSFLGYAKGPDEIIMGTVHGCEVPYGIDQIESGAWGVMRFLFNAMEQGYDYVSSGGVSFKPECNCNFAILANPVGYTTDPAKSFSQVLDHISWNPAIGRRFGIILYGDDFKKPRPPSDSTLDEWDRAISFFRAVEEYAQPELKNLYEDPSTYEWISEPIPAYKDKIMELTSTITHDTVRTFLREHGSAGQHRVKAAALNVAIVENLDKIALKNYDKQTILDEAQDHLSIFIEINLESIINIIRGLEEALIHLAQTAFANLSQYQQEIVSAVEIYRRQGIDGQNPVFNLSYLTNYIPSKDTPYSYFSQCISKLRKLDHNGSTFTKFNEKTQRYFGFSIKPISNDFEVFLNDTEPVDYIKPTGVLPVYPSFPFTRAGREKISDLDSQQAGKRVNGVNGKKLESHNRLHKYPLISQREDEPRAAMLRAAKTLVGLETRRFYERMRDLGYDNRDVHMLVFQAADAGFYVDDNNRVQCSEA